MAAFLADGAESILFENPANLSGRRTRSLPNRDLDLSYKDLTMETAVDFRRVGSLKEEREPFDQVCACLFNRAALTGDIQFGAQRNKAIVFSLDNRRQKARLLHDPSLQRIPKPTWRSSAPAARRRFGLQLMN